MYPKEQQKDDPEVYRRYVLSHGSYKPGEQKRHYGPDWNPNEYRESVEQKRLENDGSRVHDALYWKDNRIRYENDYFQINIKVNWSIKSSLQIWHVSMIVINQKLEKFSIQ